MAALEPGAQGRSRSGVEFSGSALDVGALDLVVGQRERAGVGDAGRLVLFKPPEHVGAGKVERGEIAKFVCEQVGQTQADAWAESERRRHGLVEADDRRVGEAPQLTVEQDDLTPIGIAGAG
ncbi:MAG TPA: hypothetical protein PK954_03430, partial [Anaerolineales bacterium]|nr:hypothetical protein [Anaerolineales bacterium]